MGQNDTGNGGMRRTAEEARRWYQQNHAAPTAPTAGEVPTVPASATSHYGATTTTGETRLASGTTAKPHSDPDYHAWREQQIGALDRDYDEYRRDHGTGGHDDFDTWRSTRHGQRDAVRQVREHMEVVGSDGVHVGTVDKLRGDQIVLTRKDPAAGGVHHLVPIAWIAGVGEKVMLNRSGDAARQAWRDDPRHSIGTEPSSRALNERPGQGSDGPHILDRSFAGTYKD